MLTDEGCLRRLQGLLLRMRRQKQAVGFEVIAFRSGLARGDAAIVPPALFADPTRCGYAGFDGDNTGYR